MQFVNPTGQRQRVALLSHISLMHMNLAWISSPMHIQFSLQKSWHSLILWFSVLPQTCMVYFSLLVNNNFCIRPARASPPPAEIMQEGVRGQLEEKEKKFKSPIKILPLKTLKPWEKNILLIYAVHTLAYLWEIFSPTFLCIFFFYFSCVFYYLIMI